MQRLTLTTGLANKLFLRVDNFAMVSGRKACDMLEFSNFVYNKKIKLASR